MKQGARGSRRRVERTTLQVGTESLLRTETLSDSADALHIRDMHCNGTINIVLKIYLKE